MWKDAIDKYERRTGSTRPTKPAHWLTLAMLVLAVMGASGPSETLAQTDNWFNKSGSMNTFNPDWMVRLPDSRRITELSLPGTHETMALRCDAIVCEWVRCQSVRLEKQLRAGIRVLDIRCRHVGDRLAIHHGTYYLNAEFEDVLRVCILFLRAYPSEALLMRIKPTHTEVNNTRGFAETLKWYIEDQGFTTDGEWIPHSDYIWQAADSTSFPTLGQVRGKIIILQDFESALPFGPHWASLEIQDAWRMLDTYESFDDKAAKIVSQLEYARDGEPGQMFVNFLSGSGSVWPINVAGGGAWGQKGMNQRCYFALKHPYDRGEAWRCGAIMMDFPGAALIDVVIGHNDLGSRVLPARVSAFRVNSIWPNPARGADGPLTVSFQLPSSEYVALEAYDVAGRVVARRNRQRFTAGDHALQWNFGELPSGVYLVRLKTQRGSTARTRFIVIR